MTSEARLRQRYGAAAWQDLATDLADLLQLRRQRGLASSLVVPEQGWPVAGLAAVQLDPAAIAEWLVNADAWLQRRGDQVESLLIVGGPAIVPFASVPDPVPDHDPLVLTDWLYGQADAYSWLARWPVGRLPDRNEIRPHTLRRLLAHAAAGHRPAERAAARWLGLSTESWYHASRQVLAAGGAAGDLLIIPPEVPRADLQTQLATAGVVYCNLHGLDDAADWYGHAAGSGLVPALHPDDLQGLALCEPVVLSQACYGAALSVAADQETLALRFLQQGARAFIGSTVLSYGAFELPLSDSDLLAREFFSALMTRASIGEALQAAREAMVRTALLNQGALDDDDRKALQSFVLYGDPTLPVPALRRGTIVG